MLKSDIKVKDGSQLGSIGCAQALPRWSAGMKIKRNPLLPERQPKRLQLQRNASAAMEAYRRQAIWVGRTFPELVQRLA